MESGVNDSSSIKNFSPIIVFSSDENCDKDLNSKLCLIIAAVASRKLIRRGFFLFQNSFFQHRIAVQTEGKSKVSDISNP